MNTKRILALFLSFLLVMSSFGTVAFADNGTTSEADTAVYTEDDFTVIETVNSAGEVWEYLSYKGINALAETSATVSAYKKVNEPADVEVDGKYYEFVGSSQSNNAIEDAAALLDSDGGLILISEGTVVVNTCQTFGSKSNITVKGAGVGKTIITGNESTFENTSNGLASSNLSSEYKALIRVTENDNFKLMDMTVDAGNCGIVTKKTGIITTYSRADFKTVRINGSDKITPDVYIENVTIKGDFSKNNLMIGSSTTEVNIYAKSLTVNAPVSGGFLDWCPAQDNAGGSVIHLENSYIDGMIIGSADGLGKGYYKLEASTGVTVYTTIPKAIEVCNAGSADLIKQFCTNDDIEEGVSVAGQMVNDLTTITSGDATLLYGKNCDEMKALATEFKAALEKAELESETDAVNLHAKLDEALAINSWHKVTDGTCSVCNVTGLEDPVPSVKVEGNVDVEIQPVDGTENSYNISLKEGDSWNEGDSVEMTFPAASGAVDGDFAYVVHEHADGKYIYIGEVENGSITITNSVGFSTFTVNAGGLTEALADANSMTGNVIVEIYGKVEYTDSTPNLTGSYDSISFIGKTDDAEICLTRNGSNGYINGVKTADVYFTDLIISKTAGGWAQDADAMNYAFCINAAKSVTYTNCSFPNGSCAAQCETLYTNCSFMRSHDKYCLWTYGDNTDVTVDSCAFNDYRGIKMWSTGANAEAYPSVTVTDCDFSALTGKPAIVLTKGSSVALENNTYSQTGVLELEDDGSSNGATIVSDDPITCISDAYPNGCGVLVGDKIYRTVADAAAVAEEGSTVTLLHNSAETVELPEGVTLDKNGFTADGVTVKVPFELEGEGTEESPYLIKTLEDLKAFRDMVNAGTSFDNQFVKLTGNINLNNEEWTPIGTGARSSKIYSGNAFKGTFDGKNNTISGLTITSTTGDDDAIGLFGVVDGGTVKNLNLTNVNINVNNSDLAGCAVGMMVNNATADHITVDGAIIGNDGVGGIVGRMIISGTISNCTNNARVTSSYGGIGGIVGKAYYEDSSNAGLFASIFGCTNNGTITAPMYVGGIVGLARSNVTECINNGMVNGGTQTGGIVGQLIAAGNISDNENKAKISGKNHMGGIIGDYSQSSAYTYYNVSIENNTNRGELDATEQCAAIMGCNNIDGFTNMTASGNVSYYYVDGMELFGNPEDMIIDDTNKFVIAVAKVGDVGYTSLQAAINAATDGDTITILAGTISEDTIKLPANLKNVTFKGEEGAILKDMTIMAADGNSFSYIGLTFDGITFENSRLSFTGWRNGEEIIENLTVTNCTFKNLNDDTNSACVHINKDVSEPVNGFTFTNNVIDGATGGSKSGIYTVNTGNVVITGNTFNNIVFRPALVQLADCDGKVDNVVVSDNVFSNTTRLQIYGSELDNGDGTWTPSGTDELDININKNIFKNITGYYICTWGIKGDSDIANNYYDSDELGGKIYWNNNKPTDESGLEKLGIYPIYTELNEDGTINEESAYAPVTNFVAKIGDVEYESLEEAVNAVKSDGGTLKLLADGGSITINDANKDYSEDREPITIDLNGYVLSSGESTLWVSDGYEVTVTDSSEEKTGKIISTNTGGEAIAIARGGKVTLESGYVYNPAYAVYLYSGSANGKEAFIMNGGTVVSDNGGITIAVGSGSVIINDGKVIVNKTTGGWAAYVWSGGKLNVKGGSIYGAIDGYNGNVDNSIISVSGGTFGFAGYDSLDTRLIADDYTTKVNDDGTVSVVKFELTIDSDGWYVVSSYKELVKAFETDNAKVRMTCDITGTATQNSGYGVAGICLDTGDILDGGNHRLTINGANTTWDCAIAMRGGEVKNLTISGAMRGVFMPGANGDVLIDNCVFDGVVYTFNSDAGSAEYSVTVKNSTLNGWTSYSNVHNNVIFEKCEFGEGSGYAFFRPYQPTSFTDCNFAEGYEMDTSKTEDNALSFENCTYADEPISAENAVDMFYNGGKVLIDGVSTNYTRCAQIGVGDDAVKFTSLEEAITSAADGDTITLICGIESSATIKVDENITLDLNGMTITGTDNATGNFALIEIQPGAELTIDDTSVNKSGMITLAAINDRSINNYSSVISNQRGKLIINNGTIEHLGGTYMAYGIDNLTNGKGTYAETVINSGTVKSTYRAIRQFLNGIEAQNILTVTGGTVEGANRSIWTQQANANANPGTLTVGAEASLYGNVLLSADAAATEYPVTLSIASEALKNGATVVTGNAGLPAGYVIKETNGTFGVVEESKFVAKIGNVEYTSLEKAINSAADGDTITMLADVSDEVVVSRVAIINLNGFTANIVADAGYKLAKNEYQIIVLEDDMLATVPAFIRNIATTNTAGEDRYQVIFLAGIDSLDYSEVGFEITIAGETREIFTKTVYSGYKAAGRTYAPNEFGGESEYIFGQAINFKTDLKSEKVAYRPYAKTFDGEYIWGITKTFDAIYNK